MNAPVENNFAVARHPIYHVDGNVFGYELLYRRLGGPNSAVFTSDVDATLSVLANGLDALSRDISPQKKIFINFPREVLEKGYHKFLDTRRCVIEVLEHVQCDAAFTKLVQSIHQAGYVLALDDYVGDPSFDSIMPFVTYIKIDFLILRGTPQQLEAVVAATKAAGKTLLAEKVETEADIAWCREREIPLAQGYFYSRPQVVTTKILGPSETVRLGLLAELSRPDPDERKVRDIIASDVSLTYKLLRHINAARFYRGQVVDSLDFAITRLGHEAVRSWLIVNLLASLGATPRDRELAFASSVRGRFLALVDRLRGGVCHKGEGICLLGLLSLLDAMLGVSMRDALAGVVIEGDIRQALLGVPGRCTPCLALCREFEGQPGVRAEKILTQFGLGGEAAAGVYFNALSWAAEVFRG